MLWLFFGGEGWDEWRAIAYEQPFETMGQVVLHLIYIAAYPSDIYKRYGESIPRFYWADCLRSDSGAASKRRIHTGFLH